MKRRVPILLAALFTVLILSLALTACGGEEKKPSTTTTSPTTTPDSNTVSITFIVGGKTETVSVEKGTVPSYEGSTIKPSDDTSTYRFTGWDKEFSAVNEDTTYTALYDTVPLVTYEIRWMLYDKDVTTTVKENDVPVPPAYDEVVESNKYVATFKGWNTELVPMTAEHAASIQNRMIRALYDSVDRKYQVKFMVDGQLYDTTETFYGETPTLPKTAPTKTGYRSVMWLGSDQPITDNEQVCTAVFTATDGDQLLWALNNTTPLSYKGITEYAAGMMTAANCVLYLTYEIRNVDSSNPYYTTYVNRVVEQLKLLVDPTEDGAPYFELSCNWPYCNLTAAITLCKNTPAVWDQLTADEKARYDFIMECFAYILALGTDDNNNYKTGPGLIGNFGKGWNPNYRLANIMPMVFVGEYFGGAAPVDELLLSFDYDTVIAKFQEYGFTRAYERWTTTPAQKEDGTYYPTPKDYMMNGGEINLNVTDERLHYVPGTSGGTGVGVRTNYTYGGKTLDEPEKIVASLLTNNYSGGVVKSSYGTYPDGTPKAYIDGYLKSPYEGELGLMLEFAGGDGGNGKDGADIRSSTSYCSHDFIMIIGAMIALTELDIYDPMDNDNLSLFRLVWVGNQDLIFKLEKGYMSYSLGASKGISREGTSNGYMLMKSWWNMKYGEMKLESFPEPIIIFNPLILKEDFTGSKINADASVGVTYNDVDYATTGKTGATMQTVTEGTNSYLKVQVNAGGGDPIINVQRTGGLAALMGDYKSFTVTVDLAKIAGMNVLNFNYRLRAGNYSNVSSVFRTTASGEVVFGEGKNQKTIATLTTEFQTIAVSVNFETATMTAYLNGTEVATTPLITPVAGGNADTTATNSLEWMKSIGSYICNWYCSSCSKNEDDRALLIDNFQVRVDAPFSPDEEAGGDMGGGFEE